ncbi:Ydr279p protein family (RNase H2 complex component) [Nesidiocoris tenuis]|uniref:Ribonuclease H2 subunit B n=1 Tax=Nesidiocoris tenuis TaxID=355587 RepID=A0ABN7B3Y2_9HEMI|nr:Ydr279p protein family (RNase H2 complex component) [Nesidiocoris tenuis]
MSRKAKKEDIGTKKNSSSTLPKRRVVIVKDALLESDSDQNPTFVQLRHPSSGKAAMFLFNGDNSKVNEVMQFSDPKRSYFIDQTVCSDGDMYFCTPIDPLFLVLPYLMKAERCSPLDQTLLDDELPEVARLSQCPMDVNLIADRRGLETLNAFVYNEDKTLLWLQTKLERLIPVLRQKTINTSKNVAVSANFVKIGEEEDSNVNYLRYAYGLLCDYIPESLAAKFADFIKLPPELERVSKRKEIVSPTKPDGKKVKLDDDDEAYEAKTPVSKIEKKAPSAKEQALAKAAIGSKSISSFFKKK